MVQYFDEIPERLHGFLQRSHVFFVATAPLHGGSVNVSPKSSAGAFEIVNANRVRYLDFTGSGNETISHLLEPGNGRITVMFVNIEDGPPNIFRMYGKGTVHERLIADSESKFSEYLPASKQPLPPGTRAMIDIAIHTTSTSCGYSVPIYQYVKERSILSDWATRMECPPSENNAGKKYNRAVPTDDLFMGKGVNGRPPNTWIEAYWVWANALSIDGLPGLKVSQSLADEAEKAKLLQQRQIKDNLEPPTEYAGPFRPSVPPAPVAAAVAGTAAAGSDALRLMLAFTLGCALTAALLLGPKMVGVYDTSV